MKYRKFKVTWLDADDYLCTQPCESKLLAKELKIFLNSLKWAGEKLNEIKIVSY
jgi:hypothetical protein